MVSVFSVDVEDWFHILNLPSGHELSEWDSLPSRVETDFRRLLDLFSRHGVRVTCFFLGWVAERFPDLVREANELGHEVASHGYSGARTPFAGVAARSGTDLESSDSR